MEKGADAFRSIGEVAKLVGVAPHVLRYWETQFSLLTPMKRRDGRRYYRPDDVRLVAGLCEILREEGLTIRGARKLLARDRGESVRARGAARLGDALGALPEASPAAEPVRRTVTAKAQSTDDQPANDAAQDEATRAPRSRKRARHPAPAGGVLPLFPEFAVQAASVSTDPAPISTRAEPTATADRPWLGRLVVVAAGLREWKILPPAAKGTVDLRPSAERLRKALAAAE